MSSNHIPKRPPIKLTHLFSQLLLTKFQDLLGLRLTDFYLIKFSLRVTHPLRFSGLRIVNINTNSCQTCHFLIESPTALRGKAGVTVEENNRPTALRRKARVAIGPIYDRLGPEWRDRTRHSCDTPTNIHLELSYSSPNKKDIRISFECLLVNRLISQTIVHFISITVTVNIAIGHSFGHV